ncbi:MAG: chemotaxis protein CheW [Anaerolineales bacterium]|nr:chemotaxis protein CheW [Anaerolineales bacterium]
MSLLFDISEDELPIFQAEVKDQIDTLEKGFLRLEQDQNDVDLLQEIFRAAHTIKGSAGLIGHDRMTRLTHVMESVLDSLRKGEITVSADMVDICLESIDVLSLLRDEVADNVMRVEDIEPLVESINFLASKRTGGIDGEKSGKTGPATSSGMNEKEAAGMNSREAVKREIGEGDWQLEMDIEKGSIASAARAFQVILALQSMGTITYMHPDQKAIETAIPIAHFVLSLESAHSREQIGEAVLQVSEIYNLFINGERFGEEAEEDFASREDEHQKLEEQKTDVLPKLGEFLVREGHINEEQLQKALASQRIQPPPIPMLGQLLVQMGFISQPDLDRAVAKQVTVLRDSLKTAQTNSGDTSRAKAVDQMVRTSVERLDSLMNLAGELITSRNRLNRVRNDFEARLKGGSEIDALNLTVAQIGRITDQLQEEIMEIRMLPVANVFNKYPRLVRDLARKANKRVDLEIYGEETELDRSVIDKIRDPLVHLLRNAVDHGIESPADRAKAGKPERGTVRLSAEHENGQIIISLSDDGGGIDTEKLRKKALERGLISDNESRTMQQEDALELIFRPGLSTAEKLSDISGRGVGMDIVRNNVESIGGSILVESESGQGTRFHVILPLTLAIVPTLLVGVQTKAYAIPLAVITETLHISVDSIQTIKEQPVIVLRDKVLPVLKLSDVLGFGRVDNDSSHVFVVAIQAGKNRVGLIVDTLLGEEELMVKSIEELVGRTRGIAGAAILGDGQVALIIDVQGLLLEMGKHRFRRAQELDPEMIQKRGS